MYISSVARGGGRGGTLIGAADFRKNYKNFYNFELMSASFFFLRSTMFNAWFATIFVLGA